MSWSVIQSASATNAGSGNAAVTFSTANLSSGSKIIALVTVSCSNTSFIVSGVSDGTNSLTLLASKISGDFAAHTGLYAMDTPSGDVGTKPTITATIGSNFGASIIVQEVSGLLTGNTSAMLDGSAVTATGTASPATGGSYSSTAASEYLVIGYGDEGNAVTFTTPSGYTAETHNVSGNNLSDAALFYKNSTGGAESASIALSGAATWDTIFAAFQLASGNATPSAGVATVAAKAPQPGIAGQVTSQGVPVNTHSTTGSVTGTWPTGSSQVAGRLLVAVVTAAASTSAGAISTPSGWTNQVTEGNSGTAHATCAVFTKTAAGGDAAPTFTSTESGTAGGMNCMLFELINANTTTPVDTSGVFGSGSSTATLANTTFTVTTSAAPAAAGEYAIAVFSQERAAASLTFTDSGTGWTKLLNGSGVSTVGQAAILVQQNPATSGTLNDHGQFSTDTTAFGAAIVVVFAQAVPGTTVTAGVAAVSAAAPATASNPHAGVAAVTAKAPAASIKPYIAGLAGVPGAGYFVDQSGQPRLWVATETWGLPPNAGAWSGSTGGTYQQDYDNFFAARAAQGFTVMMTDPVWAHNGTQSTNGDTWDSVTPLAGGSTDPSSAALNSTFWTRIDYMLGSALANGITVAINLHNDSDDIGSGLWQNSWTATQWQAWANKIATRYLSQPNLIWLVGNDAFSPFSDTAWNGVLAGLSAAGDTHLISAWYNAETTSRYDTSSNASEDWGVADAAFNFCYTYNAGYFVIEYAYGEVANEGASNLLPVIWGDGFFWNGASAFGYDSTQDRALRQEWWWCLASGARGILGEAENVYQWSASTCVTAVTGDWFFANNAANIVTAFTGLTGWHQLIPDTGNALVTAGRGTRVTGFTSGGSGGQYEPAFTNSYVAASRTPDTGSGSTLAVLYLPNHTTITIDQTKMVSGYTATWVDPISGATSSATVGSTYNSTAKGTNSQGDPDWVLVLQASTGTTVTAGVAAVTAAAPAPAASITANAGVAAVSATAPAASAAAAVAAGAAAASSAAPAPGKAATATAGVATSLATGTPAGAAETVTAGAPQVAAAAPAPSVSTSGSTTATAGVAAATAGASPPVPQAAATAGVASSGASAPAPSAKAAVQAGVAASTAQATAASVTETVTVTAGVAAVAAVAPAASVSASGSTTANAGAAAVTAAAPAPSAAGTATAGVATAGAAAPAPVAGTAAAAGSAATTATAAAPSAAETANAGAASVITAATAATANTSGSTTASAGVAQVAAAATSLAPAIQASAAAAPVQAAAPAAQPVHGVTATAGVAAVMAVAPIPSLAAAATAQAAVILAAGLDVPPVFTLGFLTASDRRTGSVTASDQRAGGPS